MADFAPNYTARLKVKYFAGGHEHTITLRGRGNGSAPDDANDLQDTLNAFLNVVETVLFSDFAILSARYAENDSDIFLPVPLFTYTFAPSATAPNKGDSPQFASFQGLTTLGNRASIILFGVIWAGDGSIASQQDYRVATSENTTALNAVNFLNENEFICGIDRRPVSWYPYVNLGYNAHYQRIARR